MISNEDREKLEKQQYRMVGSHSTVKVCGWTKQLLKGEGGCYKFKFYGINTLQCLQMSTSLSCANRCIFCWRDYKSPVAPTWGWDVDEPQFIFDGSIHAQEKLLEGFGGNDQVDQDAYQQTKTVRHVALSLTGEPIIYPKLNEFIDICHSKRMSTFVVTNGQYPDAIKHLKRATQLYLSMDATTPEMMKKISVPLFDDYWKRWNDSLDAVRKKDFRTAVRITMMKGYNDTHEDIFADMVHRCNADIIEVKAYMHVGASQSRLPREAMPHHCEVVDFAKRVLEHLPDYGLVSEHVASKVVLLAKKSLFDSLTGVWETWIDFDAFFAGEKSYNEPMPPEFVGLPSQDIVHVKDDPTTYFKEIKRLIDEEKTVYLPLAMHQNERYTT